MKCLYVSLFLLLQSFQQIFCSDILKVSIYYEALCPDSALLFTRDIAQAFPIVENRIELDLVPFGKATQRNENGRWKFSCQHGQNECFANKIQACALHQNASQAINGRFVDCLMKLPSYHRYNPPKVYQCANDVGISFNQIEGCMKSDLKDQLLAHYGERTLALNPVITFIPTVVFNDRFDSFLQNDALEDFLGTVCSQLTDPLPKGCTKKQQNWMFFS